MGKRVIHENVWLVKLPVHRAGLPPGKVILFYIMPLPACPVPC
jgi:hypothetical protein